MANPGKNKLLRYVRLYVDGYDLSGDSRTFSSLDGMMAEVDMTAWNDSVYKYLPNYRKMLGLRGYRAFMNDTALSGAHTLFTTPGTAAMQFIMAFGGNAEPEVNDPGYGLSSVQLGDNHSFDAEAAVLDVDLIPMAGEGSGDEKAWGHMAMPKTTQASSTDGTSHDGGAASSNGWMALLQIFSSGSDWAIEMEDSTNDSIFVNLGTFLSDGSTITGELLEGTGNVDQYTRLTTTKTSGDLTVACLFIRK